MSKKTTYRISVNGRDISDRLAPILIAATVTLRAGDVGDMAALTLDDTDGRIDMPATGAVIQIALGWAGEGQRVVFDGTVDEAVSTASRGSGLTLAITAKGFQAGGQAKDRQRRHWDDATVEKIIEDAASAAGIGTVRVDPDLAGITLKYWAMDDESLIAMGRRLAARIGGDFQVQGDIAQMARRGASYSPLVTAARGINLHGWNMAPTVSREIYRKVVAPYFDRASGAWKQVEVETGLESDAVLKISPPANDEADAARQAKAQAEACKRAAGGGQVTIEGTSDAVPGGACVLSGARPGVDGTYRITEVGHSISRDGGWVTTISIGNAAQGGEADAAA